MRAFVYCRVSTEEQSADNHYSLDYQEESARLRIKEKNWAAYKIRKDVASGKSTENRPGYSELVQDIRQKNVDVVIVYKLDRLSRNVKDIYDFLDLIKDSSVGFLSLTEGFDTTTPMGRAMLGVAAVFAQLTRETIAENTKNGLLQRARQGKYTSGGPPVGFQYARGIGLVVEPTEALVVRRIFDLYVNQKFGASKIAKLFNLEGVPSKKGAEWSANLISNTLHNPIMVGKVRHKGGVFEGVHEAIVDEDTFQAAQRMFEERSTYHHRRRTSKFLLSGVARCGVCGRHLQARYKDKPGKWYACKGNEKVAGSKACKGLSKSARMLDEAVVEQVKAFAQQGTVQHMALEEARELLELEMTPYQEERDRTLLALNDLNVDFTRWADRLDRGQIDEEQFNLQNSRLRTKKTELQAKIKELDGKLLRQSRAQVEYETVKEALKDFDRLWEVASLEEQKELVRMLVERLDVWPDAMILKLKFGSEQRYALRRGRKAEPVVA